MRTVLVDTSAIMALLVPTDAQHAKARRAFVKLADSEARLLVTSYSEFAPLLDTVWVGSDEHDRGLDIVDAGGASGPSLFDAVSFVVARQHDVEHVFAYDAHFTKAGFVAVT